jgi:hypothetical protein
MLVIDDPDTAALLRQLQLPAFAQGPLHIDASMSSDGKRTRLDVQTKAGDITASVSGSLAALGLRDADLQFRAEALDAARVATAFDVEGIPAAKVEVAGHMAATGMDLKLEGVTAKLGGTEARIDGTIPANREQPTTLHFDVSAQSLAELKATLPAVPLKVSGELTRGPERIELANLVAKLGKTDLQGKVMVQGGAHRRLEADVTSPLLDLTPLLGKAAPASQPDQSNPQPKPQAQQHEKKYLLPESPLPVAKLQGLDAKVHLNAGELRADTVLLKDVDALVSVNDGKLQAQARASGGYGGSLDGSASVVPSSGDTVALKVNVKLQDLRAGLAGGDEVAPAEVPPTSLLADITASGATPHAPHLDHAPRPHRDRPGRQTIRGTPRSARMKPACPHCDQPDMSLLRVVLIGEVLCADASRLALLADLMQACGVLACPPETDAPAAARARPHTGTLHKLRRSSAHTESTKEGDRAR